MNKKYFLFLIPLIVVGAVFSIGNEHKTIVDQKVSVIENGIPFSGKQYVVNLSDGAGGHM